MKQQFLSFLLRWALNSLGLFLAVYLLGNFGADIRTNAHLGTFLLAGLVFSIVNAVIRPFIVIFSLPAILFTLGLFMLVVNGLMVYLAISLVPNLQMSFGSAILAGMIMSLVNYVITELIDMRLEKVKHET